MSRLLADLGVVRDQLVRLHDWSNATFRAATVALVAVSALAWLAVHPAAAAVPTIAVWAATFPSRWTVRAVWARRCHAAGLVAANPRRSKIKPRNAAAKGSGWQQQVVGATTAHPKLRRPIEQTDHGWTATVAMPAGLKVEDLARKGDDLAGDTWFSVTAVRDGKPGVGKVTICHSDPFADAHPHPDLHTPRSIHDPCPVAVDQAGHPLQLSLTDQAVLAAGVLGSGKSVTVTNIVAHALLDPLTWPYILDGAMSDYQAFQPAIAAAPHGSYAAQDVPDAIKVLSEVKALIEQRQQLTAELGMRKITADDAHMFPPILLVVSEWQSWRMHAGQRVGDFDRLLGYILSNYRKAHVFPVLDTQDPRHDQTPVGQRNLCTIRWCGRVMDDTASDVALGHGRAAQGVSSMHIPGGRPGVGWWIADIPTMARSYRIDDADIDPLVTRATQLRRDQSPKEGVVGARSAVRVGSVEGDVKDGQGVPDGFSAPL